MARRCSITMKRRMRGRGRLVAGALLAIGMTPLAAPPPARADVVDEVVDQLLAPFMDAATNTLDWDALATPAAWDAFFDPAHWDAVDHAALFAAPAAADASDLTALFQQYVYTPIHTGVEDWIHSDLGAQVDGFINQFAPAGTIFIGNGVDGTSAANPDGVDVLWFGDGGDGWDSTVTGTPGGDGGDAGIFGNGGAGGDGGADAAGGSGGAGGSFMGIGGHGGNGGDGTDGGAGGDGGNATGLFGSGGDGGDGGTGVYAGNGDLPALGGAGGNSGWLGEHGAVGHPGTLIGAPVAGTDGLSTTGTWITDASGRVVILHGFNEVYKIPPFEPSAGGFGDDDAKFLADNGFNAVRLGVIWAGVEPAPGVIDYGYLDSIDQTVQTLAKYGVVSVLDFHQDDYSSVFAGEGAPEWATQTGGLPNPDFGFPANYALNPAENHAWDAFWSNADASDGVGLENHYARMAEAVANYFKDNPDIAGYEVMNEPWPGSQALPSVFGSPFFDAQQLTPFYDQVTSAIRAVDPTTPVLVEPNTLFNEGLPTHLGTVDDPHTVFAFHDYCTPPLNSAALCPLWNDLIMDNVSAYAGPRDMPGLITEFGSGNGSTAIGDTMNAADQHQYGWLQWAYNGQPSITGTSPGNALVVDPSQPLTGDNVDTARLEVSAAPYPQLVAGTPNSWSFDSAGTGTFQLSYSTEMADGSGSFDTGAQTEISVPTVVYPNGYQVDVTGGHVVSAPDAPVLVIESDAGATTVNVTVSAAGGA